VLHASEVREHLLLRLFAHRAGVEDDEVGVFRALGRLHAVALAQHVGDPVRVVLVHLAAERAQVDLAHYRVGVTGVTASLPPAWSFAAGCWASWGVRIQTWRTMPSRSSRYLTCEPGGTAVGTTRRLFWSRIWTPGASRTATPLI